MCFDSWENCTLFYHANQIVPLQIEMVSQDFNPTRKLLKTCSMENSLSVNTTISEEAGNHVEDESFSSLAVCKCHKIPDTKANMSIVPSSHRLSHTFLLLSNVLLVVSQWFWVFKACFHLIRRDQCATFPYLKGLGQCVARMAGWKDPIQEPIRHISPVTSSRSGSARLARDKCVVPGTDRGEKATMGDSSSILSGCALYLHPTSAFWDLSLLWEGTLG